MEAALFRGTVINGSFIQTKTDGRYVPKHRFGAVNSPSNQFPASVKFIECDFNVIISSQITVTVAYHMGCELLSPCGYPESHKAKLGNESFAFGSHNKVPELFETRGLFYL